VCHSPKCFNAISRYAVCHSARSLMLFVAMLSVILLGILMLSVAMLSVVLLSVLMLSGDMLNPFYYLF
jgi:hypothetical protein